MKNKNNPELAEIIRIIGKFYGTYKEENGEIIIDNGLDVFTYETPLEACEDWIYTILEDDATDWSEELSKLFKAGIQVKGLQPVFNSCRKNPAYKVFVEYPVGKNKTLCTICLGIYDNPQKAYNAMQTAIERRNIYAADGKTIEEFVNNTEKILQQEKNDDSIELVSIFARLWGQTEALGSCSQNQAEAKEAESMKAWDSEETTTLFLQWAKEYINSPTEDTVEFFNEQLHNLKEKEGK